MKRLLVLLLGGVVIALIVPRPRLLQAHPSSGTATVAVDANVRDMPHRVGSRVLEVLKAGTTVEVYKKLDDDSWIGVMWGDKRHGWMHQSVLTIDPAILQKLPVATDDLMQMDMDMPMPTPTAPPATPTAAAAPTATAEPGALAIVALPPGDLAADAAPLVTLPITVQICVDLNASKSCDADAEGVAQIPVVVADTRRAAVIGRQLTNTAGVASLSVSAPAGNPLTVSVPSLSSVQTLTMPQAGSSAVVAAIKPVVLPPPTQLWPLP